MGTTVKHVTCANCRCAWVYAMQRAASAGTATVMFIGEESVAQRAKGKALMALRQTLELDCEVIPCPQCAWLQPEMVAKERWRSLRAAVPWFAGAIILLALSYSGLRREFIPNHPHIWRGIWIGLAVLIVASIVRIMTRDLNGDEAASRARAMKSQPPDPRVMLKADYEAVRAPYGSTTPRVSQSNSRS